MYYERYVIRVLTNFSPILLPMMGSQVWGRSQYELPNTRRCGCLRLGKEAVPSEEELVEDQHHSLQEIRREQLMKQALLPGQQAQGPGGHGLFSNHFQTPYVLPSTEYTTVCNTDFAPLICNEFVSSFLQQDGQGMGLNNNEGKLERREAIDLTRHLCHWLSKEAMTCAVVELNS